MSRRTADTDLVSRPCPSAEALRNAARADSALGRDVFPRRTYVTYLLNGRIVAANLRQDSLPAGRTNFGIEALDTLSTSAITDIQIYKTHEVPSHIGVCPGVTALDVRTTGSA